MQKALKLKTITIEDKETYLIYVDGWKDEPKIIPYSSGLRGRTFEVFLSDLDKSYKGIINPERFVPDVTYILVDENNHIYGALNLRLYLNKHLYETGGHIGYGIHPKYRKLGLGTLILKLGLKKAYEYGIKDVLITCLNDNEASKKVIKHNGGILENILVFDHETVERYWIHLDGSLE